METTLAVSTRAEAPAQARAARRIVWTLFAVQCLGVTGVLAGTTVNAIAGRHLTGTAAWATLPEALYHLGSAAAAFGWAWVIQRLGWRRGLALGLGLGAVGGLITAAAVPAAALGVFLAGLLLLGVAHAALRLARFAAAEVHRPEAKGRAIATVVMGGAVATLIWPVLSRGLGPLAGRLGLGELTWPYLAIVGLCGSAALVVWGWLRPDPRAWQPASAAPAKADAGAPARPIGRILAEPAVRVAVLAMVLAQAVMVAIMVITPLYMHGHAHAVQDIAAVISAHVFGMYAFSMLSGRLADRAGRGPTLIAGSVILAVACLSALLSPELLPMGAALFLLGLGWNLCYVGGSSLLADQLAQGERAPVQGLNDLLMSLVSAGGSLLSGVAYAAAGYAAMCLLGAAAAAALLALTVWWRLRPVGAAVVEA